MTPQQMNSNGESAARERRGEEGGILLVQNILWNLVAVKNLNVGKMGYY